MGYPSGGSLATSVRSIEVADDGSFALRGKTYTVVIALAAGVGQSVAVPTFTSQVPVGTSPAETTGTAQASHVAFSATAPFWANYDIALAAVPSANITDGTAPEFAPAVRLITDVTTIYLISAGGALVSMMYYQG
jgi:hypothetical protein